MLPCCSWPQPSGPSALHRTLNVCLQHLWASGLSAAPHQPGWSLIFWCWAQQGVLSLQMLHLIHSLPHWKGLQGFVTHFSPALPGLPQWQRQGQALTLLAQYISCPTRHFWSWQRSISTTSHQKPQDDRWSCSKGPYPSDLWQCSHRSTPSQHAASSVRKWNSHC